MSALEFDARDYWRVISRTAEARLAGAEIDTRVRDLVIALTATPGIVTFSSCGGHRGRRAISQVRTGEFYVCFSLGEEGGVPTLIAWESLRRIAEAASLFWPHVAVTAWDNGGVLDFEIKGRRGVEPSAIATELIALVYGHDVAVEASGE